MNLSFLLQMFGGFSGIAKAAVRSITDRIKEGAVDTDVQAAAARITTLPQAEVDALCKWAGYTDPAEIAAMEALAKDAGAKYGQFLEQLAAKKLDLTLPS